MASDEACVAFDCKIAASPTALLAIAEFVENEAGGQAARKVQDKKELTITNKHFTAALRVMESQPR